MITVFTCENDLASMLTCMYEAMNSRLGFANIRLQTEPFEDINLFERYIHVDADEEKANIVRDTISRRVSEYFFSELAYCAGAYEADTLDIIYRMMLLGLHYGPSAFDMYQYKEVVRFREIAGRYGREANSFLEFVRFNRVGTSDVYVSHIEPKSHVLVPIAEHFSDRMPSEHWMIVDDAHREAAVHPINSHYYLVTLNDLEFERLKETEKYNDGFTNLWQHYFDHIAIKERANYRCQLNHFPLWKRKHVTEFMR